MALLTICPAVGQVVLTFNDAVETGSWQTRTEAQHAGSYLGGGSRFANGPATSTFTPNISTAGNYSVEVWYPTTAVWTTDAPFTVNHANGSTLVSVNESNGDTGGRWVSLGVFELTAGTGNTLQLGYNSGNTNISAVRFSNVATDSFASFFVDSGSSGGVNVSNGIYTETGSWSTSVNQSGYLDGVNDRVSDTNGSTASVQADLVRGLYQVDVSWEEETNRADNALFQVTESDGSITDVRIDQTLQPVGDLELGTNWQNLGTFDLDDTSTIAAVVDASAGGFVVSDGYRITWLSAVPEPGTGLLLLGGVMAGIHLLRRRS